MPSVIALRPAGLLSRTVLVGLLTSPTWLGCGGGSDASATDSSGSQGTGDSTSDGAPVDTGGTEGSPTGSSSPTAPTSGSSGGTVAPPNGTTPPDEPDPNAPPLPDWGLPRPPLPPPPPVGPAPTATPVPITSWMVGSGVGATACPTCDRVPAVLNQLATNAFTLPAVGSKYGLNWRVAPGGNTVSGTGGALLAATVVKAPDGTRLLARLDETHSIFANNTHRQTGIELYLQVLVPLQTKPGDNLIVVFGDTASTGTEEATIEVFATTSEILFNPNRVMTPTYAEGDRSEQYVGISVLNLKEVPALDVIARVLANDVFEESVLELPSLPALATTEVPFALRPKAPIRGGLTIPVKLRLEPRGFEHSYETTVQVRTVGASERHTRTRRSRMDGSVQYYGVVPPVAVAPGQRYGLILALHPFTSEAGSSFIQTYSRKDWAYVIAPTNRGRGGFNWEGFGRADAVEALDDAMNTLPIDDTRVHLSGHSMGGHGTYHLGVHMPWRFGVIAPSAGWRSVSEYLGINLGSGALGRSRAASSTQAYFSNLKPRSIFLIHGTNDDSVPFSESQATEKDLKDLVAEFEFHVQQGARHWWDASPAEGSDCVDLAALMARMKERRSDPRVLDFDFKMYSPSLLPTHSYVTVESQTTPMMDSGLLSKREGETVHLTLDNVRSATLNGDLLTAAGIKTVQVNGTAVAVAPGKLPFGPRDGKTARVHGPISQVFQRPFCFVYDDMASPLYRHYISYLTTRWATRGFGNACAVPLSSLWNETRKDYNLIYVGIEPSRISGFPASLKVGYDGSAILFGGQRYEKSAAFLTFPGDNQRLSAAFLATTGFEHLLGHFEPFTGFEMPDFAIWGETRGKYTLGYFDPEWNLRPELAGTQMTWYQL